MATGLLEKPTGLLEEPTRLLEKPTGLLERPEENLLPYASQPSALESFSAQDLFMIERTEEAIQDGGQLARWCRRQDSELALCPLELKNSRLPNRAYVFFDSLEINGKCMSVMGCRQEIEFSRIAGTKAPALLREFVLGEFLKRAHWTYEDGSPGGFTIEQSLYKTVGGEYGRLPVESRKGCIDWRQLNTQLAWVLLTIEIHDFVVNFGPFRKKLREALCAVAHSDFVRVVENPSEEYTLEVSIGYPVVRFAPTPNIFGFGPGKFNIAVKLFSFFLTPKNEIHVRMVFAAADRCQKVLDFGKHWPDPVYGGASLLHYLTLGRWNPEAFHNLVDGGMLAQHCRVHQALMEGVEKIWNDWVSERAA